VNAILPVWGIAVLAAVQIGCSNKPSEYLTVADFDDYETYGSRWKAEHIFSDADLLKLAKAIEKENTAEIDRTIAAGAKIEGTGLNEVTPLGWAILSRKKKSYKHLLEKGADPNHRFWKKWPLVDIVAGFSFDPEWLELALKHGGDPNIDNGQVGIPEGNETPLFRAVRSRKISNVDLLIKAKANLDHQKFNGDTPITQAVDDLQFDIAYRLLEAGARPDVKHPQGRSFLHEVLFTTLEANDAQWPWQARCMTLLESKGYDLEAFAKADPDPVVYERWLIAKQRRATEAGVKQNQTPHVKP
jgi:hypothetical protein